MSYTRETSRFAAPLFIGLLLLSVHPVHASTFTCDTVPVTITSGTNVYCSGAGVGRGLTGLPWALAMPPVEPLGHSPGWGDAAFQMQLTLYGGTVGGTGYIVLYASEEKDYIAPGVSAIAQLGVSGLGPAAPQSLIDATLAAQPDTVVFSGQFVWGTPFLLSGEAEAENPYRVNPRVHVSFDSFQVFEQIAPGEYVRLTTTNPDDDGGIFATPEPGTFAVTGIALLLAANLRSAARRKHQP